MSELNEWETLIEKIKGRIKNNHFQNEEAVKNGIIMPILQLLNWDIFDPTIVAPEFKLDSKRVDLALCNPPNKAAVIIEAKMIDKIEGGAGQLFQYAFTSGVPIAILTDGQEWHFYLPGGQGSIIERRFYKIDLLERKIEEIKERFERYLQYENVCSKKSFDYGRKDHEDTQRIETTLQNIPLAWSKLIEEKSPLLIKALSDKVSDLCGLEPNEDDIQKFLKNLSNTILRKNNEANHNTLPNPAIDSRLLRTVFQGNLAGNVIESFPDRCLIIRIKKNTIISRGSVYEAVRRSWKLSKEHAEQADYILALEMDSGIVKGVFRADNWLQDGDRYYFEGSEITEGIVVEQYLNKHLPANFIQPGSQNPIKYTW